MRNSFRLLAITACVLVGCGHGTTTSAADTALADAVLGSEDVDGGKCVDSPPICLHGSAGGVCGDVGELAGCVGGVWTCAEGMVAKGQCGCVGKECLPLVCLGEAPGCFDDLASDLCCAMTAASTATCQNGTWTCPSKLLRADQCVEHQPTYKDCTSQCNTPPPTCYADLGLDCCGDAGPPPSCVDLKWACPKGTRLDCVGHGAKCIDRAKCVGEATSTLPGVSIAFKPGPCSWTLDEAMNGESAYFTLTVADDLPGVSPEPSGWGWCDKPGPSGLFTSFVLFGGGQSYCICDSGLCEPPTSGPPPVTLKAGTYDGFLNWQPINWSGPSDYNAPKGAPFPPGDYALVVSAIGHRDVDGVPTPFKVSATWNVTIVP